MKTLLTKIKAAAVAAIAAEDLDYLRPGDIFITAHEDLLPVGVRLPALGIKDGPVVRTELAGGAWEVSQTVKLVLWVNLLKDEASVMGDGSNPGILEFAADIQTVFDEDTLAITGMQEAFSSGETESEPYGNESRTMQRKIITFNYVKEENRP